MTDVPKRFKLIYQQMSVDEKYEAAQRILLVAAIKETDPQKDMEEIRQSFTNYDGWKWSNLFGKHMVEMIDFLNLRLLHEELAHLQTMINWHYETMFLQALKKMKHEPEFFERFKQLREVVPKALKKENLWKADYEKMGETELFPEMRMLEDALHELVKRMLETPYSKKLDKRWNAISEVLTSEETTEAQEPKNDTISEESETHILPK